MPTATLKLFLASGDPKRLRTAELSNWTGKAVAGPRVDFEKLLARVESSSTGVYFLTGVDPENDKNAIYIGEAECISDRIKHHLSRDFWNHVCFFVTKDENLTKAHIKYLEGRLIDIARSTEKSTVMNSQGSGAKLPESDREEMEVFLEKMRQVLPVLGVDAFVESSAKQEDEWEKVLYCKIKGLIAKGYLTPNGMIVLQGSQAVKEARDSASKYPSVLVKRNKLIEEGVLTEQDEAFIFRKDVEFSSPSAAAATIHGGSANGLIAWVDSKGTQLKQLQDV